MQYSFELRRKLVEAWQNWDSTQAELAALLGVSRSWVQKVLRRFEQTGDLAAPLHRHGPVSRLSRANLRLVYGIAAVSKPCLGVLRGYLGQGTMQRPIQLSAGACADPTP